MKRLMSFSLLCFLLFSMVACSSKNQIEESDFDIYNGHELYITMQDIMTFYSSGAIYLEDFQNTSRGISVGDSAEKLAKAYSQIPCTVTIIGSVMEKYDDVSAYLAENPDPPERALINFYYLISNGKVLYAQDIYDIIFSGTQDTEFADDMQGVSLVFDVWNGEIRFIMYTTHTKDYFIFD